MKQPYKHPVKPPVLLGRVGVLHLREVSGQPQQQLAAEPKQVGKVDREPGDRIDPQWHQRGGDQDHLRERLRLAQLQGHPDQTGHGVAHEYVLPLLASALGCLVLGTTLPPHGPHFGQYLLGEEDVQVVYILRKGLDVGDETLVEACGGRETLSPQVEGEDGVPHVI